MKSFDKTWEQIHKKSTWGKYPSEDVIRFMARNYYSKNRSEIKVLDIGCGGGANTWYLATERFNTYAFDGSSSAVEKTKDLIKVMGVSANVIVCDAANLPYEDNFFDVVIDSAVIYANTMQGINSIISECCRVLKKGGSLFCSGLFNNETSGIDSGVEVEKNTYTDIKEGPLAGRGTIHSFTTDELDLLMSNNNFQIKSTDKLTRSEFNGENIISYFIIEALKK